MSILTYIGVREYPMTGNNNKPLVWLGGDVKTPPFSRKGRLSAGILLRRLQNGERLGMPESRPMPSIGRRCHELRIQDAGVTWRIVYRLDSDAIIIGHVFSKKSRKTPAYVIEVSRMRLQGYDEVTK